MDDTTNYQNIVSAIFGANTATFNTGPGITNSVIGALNNVKQFAPFYYAFVARLQRLKQIYTPGTPDWKALLVQVNQIGTVSNWEGAYSELAAYDFFHFGYSSKDQGGNLEIRLDQNVPNTDTFAVDLGKPGPANLDCFFPFFDVYSDVKSLKDIVEELLQGMYPQVLKAIRVTSGLTMLAEYPPSIDYGEIRRKRAALVIELTQKIDVNQKTKFISSSVIAGLNYKLQWDPGVLIGTRMLSATSAAEQYYKLVFGYAKKYTKTKPFILSLVSFDWFHGAQPDFQNMDRDFYRAFARRVFCQYSKSTDLFSTLDPDCIGTTTINEVMRKISAILFLRDRCILSSTPSSINVDSYLYVNPNADNPLKSSMFYDWMRSYNLNVIDRFDGDNY